MKNWKTTLCGIIVLSGTLLAQFFGEYPLILKLGGFLAALGTGLGFVLCKDHDNDDDGGASPQSVPINHLSPGELSPCPTRHSGAMSLFAAFLIAPVLLSGCAAIQKNPAQAQRIADHVAYDVATVVLDKHPEWRVELNQAALDLQILEQQPTFDALAVIEIIQRLPVFELQSTTAKIAIDGAMLTIELIGNPALKPTAQEDLRVVVRGLRIGLQRRLNEPDALHRLRSAKPQWPPVPTR